MIAAGWYPEPEGRNDFRYWNGERWTEHVSNVGIADTEPPTSQRLPPPDGGEQAALLDVWVEVQGAWRPKVKPLRIDADGVHFDGVTTPASAITGYATQAIEIVMAGVSTETHILTLATTGRTRKIEWMGSLAGKEHARRTLRAADAALFTLVGQAQLQDALRRVDAGEEVQLGGWTLSRGGAHRGPKRRFTWDEPISVVEREDHGWNVVVIRQGRGQALGGFSSAMLGGSLLLPAMQLLQERYGS